MIWSHSRKIASKIIKKYEYFLSTRSVGIATSQKIYWSGGARRARPRAENRPARGRGWLGRLVLRSFVRPFVTLEKGPKGLQNHQKRQGFSLKTEKWNSTVFRKISVKRNVRQIARLRKVSGLFPSKNGFHLDREFPLQNGSNGHFLTISPKLSRNASTFAWKGEWLAIWKEGSESH